MDMLVGKTLVNKCGEEGLADEILKDANVIAFYFSAHWCPPCRAFTPILADFYSELKDKDEAMEIIFVSSDRSLQDMMAYMKEDHGDWYAIPFEDCLAQDLKKRFNVRGIPSLIVLKRDGTIITTDGRSEIHKSGTSCFKSWATNK